MIDVIGWILREYRGLDGECPGRGVFSFYQKLAVWDDAV